MARSKGFFDDVKNHLECSVCQEQFSEVNEPKILKCLHTFCKTCLEAWLRQQREGELSCPTCRQITECPNNNINSLPSNLFCKQLVEIVEAYSGHGQEDSPHCGICDEKKALKFYCSDCNSFLCDDCVRAHKKGKVFKGHHVKEIGNFESSDVQDYARRANFCKKHKDEMRFFCERCQICICLNCAILEHQDHNKISLDQGLENNKSEIEAKMQQVQENGSRLRSCKDTLEKRRLQVNGNIEEATKEVKRVTERCILLIRQHEASVTERLVKQKAAFQDAFDNQMTSLDGKLVEIDNTLAFSEEVLLRKNLPEILNVKATIEQRLKELSVPFEAVPKLSYSGVKYVANDVSFLNDAPGKLITTDTVPSVSVAGGKGLTEGLKGADCTFTVTIKNSAGQTTYSVIDEVSVKITSLAKNKETKTVLTDLKDGRYLISYRPTTPGDFTVSIEVGGNPIMGSPFKLQVKPRSSQLQVKPERINQDVEFHDYLVQQPANRCWREETVRLVELNPIENAQEYKNVSDKFHQSCTNNIIKIERVYNPTLYQAYAAIKKRMDEPGGRGSTEMRLFHGTRGTSCQQINLRGFIRSHCGQNGLYGNGVYFALQASYSARSNDLPPKFMGNRYMYLARVLVGEYCQGRQGMIVPSPKSCHNPSDLYDTVVDNVSSPSIFVVFFDMQCYPEYLITFQ